jgi:hypothetical protein
MGEQGCMLRSVEAVGEGGPPLLAVEPATAAAGAAVAAAAQSTQGGLTAGLGDYLLHLTGGCMTQVRRLYADKSSQQQTCGLSVHYPHP